MISLDGRPVIPNRVGIAAGAFLVGYFVSVEAINDGGRPIELADLIIDQRAAFRSMKS